MIHKYKRPRCFGKTFDPNSLVNITKAWMCTEVNMHIYTCTMHLLIPLCMYTYYIAGYNRIFWHACRCLLHDWSKGVNDQFKRQKRRCLMLLDNAASHAIAGMEKSKLGSFDSLNLSNLLLIFMPANCTAIIQPLDQGIIAAFKARYKSKLAKHMFTTLNTALILIWTFAVCL